MGGGWLVGEAIKRTRAGIGSDGLKDKSAAGNRANLVFSLLCFYLSDDHKGMVKTNGENPICFILISKSRLAMRRKVCQGWFCFSFRAGTVA